MEFNSFSRRELQALCKKNKIPANLTNVAMADSLKALEIVEGMDELLASPFLPPTGGRRNAQTPACRKMDPMLNDCAQEENNDALLTPVPSSVSSRRRIIAKDDSALRQVFGTRRSARLAEKNARLLKGVRNENPIFSNKGLFADDCQESKVNLKESQEGSDETSGVTDVSESLNLEEKKDEQVDSAEKQDIATETDLLKNNHSETDDGSKESSFVKINIGDLRDVEVISVVVEGEGNTEAEVVPCEKEVVPTEAEEELSYRSGAGSKNQDLRVAEAMEDDGKVQAEVVPCDKGVVSTEGEEDSNYQTEADDAIPNMESGGGSFDIQTSETDIEVKLTQENNTNTNTNADTRTEDKAIVEKASDIGVKITEDDVTNTDTGSEDEDEDENEDDSAISETEFLSESESDISIDENAYTEEFTALDVNQNNHNKHADSSQTESDSESVILESSKSGDWLVGGLPSDIDEDWEESEENSFIYKDQVAKQDSPESNYHNDTSSFQIAQAYSTPIRSCRVMSAASDNKENKIMKENPQKMDDDSMIQLSKKMKEFYVTPKVDNNEVSARPALQLLPDNQQAD